MTFKNLAEAVDEKLALIAPVLAKIEQNGESADLRHLRLHLIDATRLFQRNPGIEAAADDLYMAAAALVADQAARIEPTSRKLRILRESHVRLRGRIEGAAERVRRYEYLVVPDFPTRQAA